MSEGRLQDLAALSLFYWLGVHLGNTVDVVQLRQGLVA